MRARVISGLAMAAAASLMAACGSSSSGSGTTVSAVQNRVESAALARYIARGDGVCAAGDAAVAPINARGAAIEQSHRGGAREVARLVPVLRDGLRAYRHFNKLLERIPPPPRDGAAVAGIMAGLGRVGDDLERLANALAAGELGQVRTITQEREMDHARVSARELEFGFKVCGQPPAGPSVTG